MEKEGGWEEVGGRHCIGEQKGRRERERMVSFIQYGEWENILKD